MLSKASPGFNAIRSTISNHSLNAVTRLLAVFACVAVLLAVPERVLAFDVCSDAEDYNDNKPCTHEEMVNYAFQVYSANSLGTELQNALLQNGAGHEDEEDHIYGWHRADVGAFTGVTVTHFWDADEGRNAPSSLGALDYAFNGGDPFPNSWYKVRQYWSMALGEYANGNLAKANHFLGHVAHHIGDNTIPTHAHVSAHDPASGDDAYEDWMSRGGKAHSFPQQDPGSDLSENEKAELRAPIGTYKPRAGGRDPLEYIDLNIDIPEVSGNEVPLRKLYWLLYTTNQIADFFPSDRVDGDTVDPEKWVQTELNYMKTRISKPRVQEHLENNDCRNFSGGDGVACISGGIDDYDNNYFDNDLKVIRDHSYLRGVRAIAAMFKLFEQTVRQEAIVSLTIKRIQELDGCDPTFDEDCDFYALVGIDNVSSVNEGDRFLNPGSDNATDISPDWAWGKAVETSGTIPLNIFILDEDISNDGLVNITAVEVNKDGCSGSVIEKLACVARRQIAANSLSLTLDLGKCVSSSSGAITGGSFTGGSKCGDTLRTDTTGDEDDDDQGIARVSFSITMTDTVPPVISCGSADGAWHAENVSIPCSWNDEYTGESGSFLLWTVVMVGEETDNAETLTEKVCDSNGNCATAGPIGGNRIDRKAPEISVVQPTAMEYVHSATLVLDYSVSDGGSGVYSATPTLNGSDSLAGHGLQSGQSIKLLTELALGPHTFQVDAVDNVGNTSVPSSVIFTIIVTPESIIDAVDQLNELGMINDRIMRSLVTKLEKGQKKWNQGQCGPAKNIYQAFINEVRAQSKKKIASEAAQILIVDAEFLIEHCSDS